MDEVVARVKDEDAWLIVKRDLYYMPNAQGYTGIRDLAGRYSHDEAKGHVYDAGPRGNSITIVKLTEAPEFTKACYPDLALKHVMKRRDELAADLLRLREGDQPVAWLCHIEDGDFVTLEEPDYGSFRVTPLYARPSSPPPECPTYDELLTELAACRDLATLASGHDDSAAIADPLSVADHVSHALSIPPEHRRSPPPGWKLVPVEPTLAMTNACMGLKWPGEGWHATSPTHRVRACATEVYRAMLAAAPETMP